MSRFRNPSDIQVGQSIGKEFEQDMIDVFEFFTKDSKTYNLTDTRDTDADFKEGTDMIIGSVHIDATCNFSQKDHMPWIADTEIPAYGQNNFIMGIRTGNAKTPFAKPVIVIGLDISPTTYLKYQDEINENMEKHTEELIWKAYDCLEDYQTTDPQERKEIVQTPILKKNPNYHEKDGYIPADHLKERFESRKKKMQKIKDTIQLLDEKTPGDQTDSFV